MSHPSVHTYDWKLLRRRYGQLLPLPCIRCGKVITPGEPFHLDHRVPLVEGGTHADVGVAHPRCNLSHGARLANARKQQKRAAELAALKAVGFTFHDDGTYTLDPAVRASVGAELEPSRIW